ncbi:CdaR family protein [Ethanoligenens harbinense]|uniref:YbbR family protein n=1 Tax=Ethanoligenens harbinense (strain DSM 18485 / JCM 12961 / CGMCC 1.5033 / YUAN-3) TaxID=663278 RepID=E6U8Q6_ETHHY|nr:CdaR family protein [Ethanoligenens harbinense]ADU27141.1 YbbR family protein [Ethanoligenens harbinense YUAN-3]AVQ96215.1 hypothetical protein CXQ68_08245 [Ethanoligenens harbinense YUAN-3]AYF38875.1 hypothetical protein CXP51_08115 [Ethanoligenens harbinense]AYF41625.1 hypothetical protein CN246_08260 [Ethanoligenens harbinense]QCN92456.1 hypothetical protein DRA42_08270 [Ethanoligenens harbinense]
MNDKGFFYRLMHNTLFLRIVSVAAAFVIWFVVVVSVSPGYTRTVSGIPVTIDTKSGFLADAGLGLVDKLNQNISIDVSGPRTTIGRLSAKDFSVTPDVTPVTKSGSYTLQLNASLKTPDSQIHIRSISPSQIQIRFDTVASKTFPVNVRVQNSKVADGYVMETATASPKEIIVSGPSAEVAQVAQVRADVDMGNGVNATYKTKAGLQLIDASGSVLNLAHVKLSVSSVSVTVPVFKAGTVPLKVNFSNLPAGFDTKNMQYTVSPDMLHIAGSAQEIDSLTQINLGTIDFRTLSLTNKIVLPVTLTGTLQNLDNLSSATVSIDLLDTVTQAVNTQDIQVVNVPSGYRVQLRTKQINGIQLYGPAAQMATPAAVTAVVDMSTALNGTGQYVVPVTISTPSGFWATGNYTAVVQVSKTK